MAQPVLSALNIYPLKSASGISLKNTEMEQRGLPHDRRWMVVDDSGQFMTQRTVPRMALVQTQLVNQTLTLNAPGMPELCLCPCCQKKTSRRRWTYRETAVRRGLPISNQLGGSVSI